MKNTLNDLSNHSPDPSAPGACDNLLAVLAAITARWPHGERKHHVVIGDSGLELGLWLPGELRRFSITPADLANTDLLLAEIDSLLAFPAPPLPPRADSRDLATGGES